MPDMESLNRAVEEARDELRKLLDDGGYSEPDLDRFEAAVSAKARAEERERVDFARCGLQDAQAWLESLVCDDVEICRHPACNAWLSVGLGLANSRARSSEEAGNG